MNKKVMLIPILALLLLAVPAAIAGSVLVVGDGEYSQTTEFGEISDSVELTGEWSFESVWSHGSRGDIENYVHLEDDSTYSEHVISPDAGYYGTGNPGLDLLTVVTYGTASIQDIADIQIRGYDFTFDVDTSSSYDSDKHLNILDSYNYWSGGCSGNDQVPDIQANRDTATFQVVDTSSSIYVVGGSVEYMKPFSSSQVSSGNVYLDQTFSTSSPDTSYVTSHFYATSHIVATAYYGYTEGSDINDLDWYGEATMDIKGNNKHDTLYARFVDELADFYTQYGKNHPMILDAYSDSDFAASGNALDVGDNGSPSFADPLPWWYEAPSDQWTFTGTDFYKYDGTSVNWLASYDMDP